MSFYSVSPVLLESVSNVTATPSVELGTRVNYKGAEYIYVQAKTAITVGCGTQAYGGGYSYTITNATPTGTSNIVFAGLVQHTTFSTDSYGWLLINGAGTFTSSLSIITATGQKVCVMALGTVGVWTPTHTTGAFAGYLLGAAVAAAVSCSVYVKSEIY